MKKIFLALGFILGALIITTSCDSKRDFNDDMLFGMEYGDFPDIDPPIPPVTKHLKSVTSIDEDGYTGTAIYTYSSDKLTHVESNDEFNDTSFTYDVFYDANDQINRIVIRDNDVVWATTTDLTISYNNGKFALATGTSTEEDSGDTYTTTITPTYTGNKITKIFCQRIYPLQPDGIDTLQHDINYTGNNISKWVSTVTIDVPPITIQPIIITSTFSEYDNHINPNSTLPEVFNIVSSNYELGSVVGFSDNNHGKMNVVTFGDNQTATATYTYDADGYPIKVVASNGSTATIEYQ
ncbi:MAG: hypothetical protein LBE36_09130 [Flavobacteriaceae bacterium]|jgi:YD repeat-containing protein|nr:hypothetical protein [Flavobacteriaceae bacterium]